MLLTPEKIHETSTHNIAYYVLLTQDEMLTTQLMVIAEVTD